MVALVVALGGAGYSATGGNFILGQSNSASTQTKLVAPFAGPALRVDNLNTGASASGLKIVTDAARPPLVVNSAVKVANLNADLLDGLDATAFVRGGGGQVDGQALALAPGDAFGLGPVFGGFVFLGYSCPVSLASNGSLTIRNLSSGVANFFVDSGGANPDYFQLSANSDAIYPAAAAGDSFSIRAQGAPGIAVVEVATVHRSASNDCHAQALFVLAS
jgi:hypothetical protein